MNNDENDIKTRPRKSTFDNSTQFQNYFNSFSIPVKDILKQHLNEKLHRDRRPTIEYLQKAGIYPTQHTRDSITNRSAAIDNYSIANPVTKQRTSEKLAQHLSSNIQPRDIENMGIVPKGYFNNSQATIAEQKQQRQKIASNLNTKLQLRPTITEYHQSGDSQDSRHLARWIYSRRRTIEELSSKGVLRSYFKPKEDLVVEIPSHPKTYARRALPMTNTMSVAPVKTNMRPLEKISMQITSQSNPIHRRLSSSARHQIAQSMESHVSALSIGDLNDSYDDSELLEHDLYHMLAHQIIPKSQQNFFQKLFREKNEALQKKKQRRPSQIQTRIRHSVHNSIHTRNSILRTPSLAPSPPAFSSDVLGDIPADTETIPMIWTPMTEISMNACNLKSRQTGSSHFAGQLSIMNLMDDARKNTIQRGTAFAAYSPQTQAVTADFGQIEDMNIIGLDSNRMRIEEESSTRTQVVSKPTISYYSMPEYIDGGIVSCGIFLPFKYHCESNILHLTEQAGRCLDRMKKESQLLEHLHRQRISESPMHDLYSENTRFSSGGGLFMTGDLYGTEDGDDMYGGVRKKQLCKDKNMMMERSVHLQRLSEIDENLADVRDQIQKMFTVQAHVRSIRQQFDTYTDQLREDQHEIVSILKELRERLVMCESIVENIQRSNVWVITNIAETIADRSEKMDRMKKVIRKCTNEADIRRYNHELLTTKTFVDDIHSLIKNLQLIFENKSAEIKNLVQNIYLLEHQNRKMVKSSMNSNEVVIDRLLALQTHYKLPTVMEHESDFDGKCDYTLFALSFYCLKANANDYYSRSLELYYSTIIYANEKLKIFFNTLVVKLNAVFIDCMLIHEYIETNVNASIDDSNSSSSLSDIDEYSKAIIKSYSISVTDEETDGPPDFNVGSSSDDTNDGRYSNSLLLPATDATVMTSTDSETKRTDLLLDDALNPIHLEPRNHSKLHSRFDKKCEHKNRKQLLSMIIDLNNVLSYDTSLVDDVQTQNIKNMKFEGIEILRKVDNECLILHSNCDREKNYTKIRLDLMQKIQIISNFGRLLPYRESIITYIAEFVAISYKNEIEECLKEKLIDLSIMHCEAILARCLFTINDKEYGLIGNIKTLIKKGKINEKNRNHGVINSGSSFNSSGCNSNNGYLNLSNLNIYRLASLILYNTYKLICPCPI